MQVQRIVDTIAQTIILPNASEQKIRANAEKMGYGTSLTRDQAIVLYNNTITEIIEKIDNFIASEESIANYKNFKSIQSNSFRTDIQEIVEKTIKNTYQIDVIPSFTELEEESRASFCVIL